MREKTTDRAHHYRATCSWSGSTGAGYHGYGRQHLATAPPSRAEVEMSADPAFEGDPARLNPEQLVVMAAASCQLLSFLAVAARARLDVVSYEDEAEGVMPEDEEPMRIREIRLRPQVVVRPPASEERVHRLLEVAHRECFVANSLNCDVLVEGVVSIRPK